LFAASCFSTRVVDFDGGSKSFRTQQRNNRCDAVWYHFQYQLSVTFTALLFKKGPKTPTVSQQQQAVQQLKFQYQVLVPFTQIGAFILGAILKAHQLNSFSVQNQFSNQELIGWCP
jgi:hypothetical protein